MNKERVRFGRKGNERVCEVTYTDESEERREALSFFSGGRAVLSQRGNIPIECYDLPPNDAQAFLDAHPLRREWDVLQIRPTAEIENEDLRRLEHLPEIRILRILSSRIGDAAFSYLHYLRSLEVLEVYTKAATDDCLREVVKLRTLRTVDFQGANFVSREQFQLAMRQLPNLERAFPPPAQVTR